MNAETQRMLAGVAMIGVVMELDEGAQRARVDADGMLTDWLPWIVRAGPGVRTASQYEPGEQVLIVCPHGDPDQGVIVGGIYRDAYPAPAVVKTTHRTEFADGSSVEYDRASTTLTVNVGAGKVVVNCATAVVAATESVTIDSPMTKATGDMEVAGAIKAGKDITTSADVKAGPISLKNHKHTAQGATAPTSPAQA
ncbi:TPA: phage baseplate assembly protein V [Stenotrophomonas maltophilia]